MMLFVVYLLATKFQQMPIDLDWVLSALEIQVVFTASIVFSP